MYVITIEKGKAMSSPDVCLTPAPPAAPVPMPYVNLAMTTLGSPATSKVTVCGAAALTKSSKIPMTNGDNAGVNGGTVSGTFLQECTFTTASSKVSFEGKPVVRMSESVKANKGNAMGKIIEPSQMKVDAS